MKTCICCKKSKVTESGQSSHCDNCWEYLMPERDHKGKKLEWGDIWTIFCHWHALHNKKDKDFEFAHDVILTAYSHKHYHRDDVKQCLQQDPSENVLCELESKHSGQHAYFYE
jgi:hypothetical protein